MPNPAPTPGPRPSPAPAPSPASSLYAGLNVPARETDIVQIFSDGNFSNRSTRSAGFTTIGSYKILGTLTSVGRNTISSIKILPGYSVEAFKSDNFTGDKILLTGDVLTMPSGWNDAIGSIRVSRMVSPGVYTPNRYSDPVRIFDYGNYNSSHANASISEPGNYVINSTKTSVGDNDISSIKIQSGWAIDAYDRNDFSGNMTTFTSDVSELGDVKMAGAPSPTSWNNKISSMRVRRVVGPSPTPTPGQAPVATPAPGQPPAAAPAPGQQPVTTPSTRQPTAATPSTARAPAPSTTKITTVAVTAAKEEEEGGIAWWVWLLIALAVLLLIGGGYYYFTKKQAPPGAPKPAAPATQPTFKL